MRFIYTVRTSSGIIFHIEAQSYLDAQHRVNAPIISKYFAQIMFEALKHVDSIEPYRGPIHLIKYPLISDALFKDMSVNTEKNDKEIVTKIYTHYLK